MTTQPVPIPYAYWVIPGYLLAGEHPGAADETEARGTLQRLLHAGITVFIDLTEAGEWDAYDHLLQETTRPVTYHRIPIVDGQPPSDTTDTTLLLTLQKNHEGHEAHEAMNRTHTRDRTQRAAVRVPSCASWFV